MMLVILYMAASAVSAAMLLAVWPLLLLAAPMLAAWPLLLVAVLAVERAAGWDFSSLLLGFRLRGRPLPQQHPTQHPPAMCLAGVCDNTLICTNMDHSSVCFR